jgi:hypothetical protein
MGYLRAALFARAISNPEMEFLEMKFYKRLESFALCYLQSFVPADFSGFKNP